MIVRMSNDEIIEACREWLVNHHNLTPSDECRIYAFSARKSDGLTESPHVSVEFDIPSKTGSPYRT